MLLKILGSSSKGNGYLLISEGGSTLIVEAGISLLTIKKAINFKISSIVGCIATHCHSDHFGKAKELLKAGIDVYTSGGTIEYSGLKHHRLHCINNGNKVKIGDFTVLAFSTIHDAPDSISFLINHPETGNILFLTDSYYSEFKFRNLNQIILEINYDIEIMNTRSLHQSIKNRIITSHMSLETAKELLRSNDLSKVNNIVLIHLSDGNSHSERFKQEIEDLTGKTVTVADAGTEINLDLTPF